MSHAQEIWFHANRYGWGCGWPASWQGWLVLLAYLGLLAGGGGYFLVTQAPLAFAFYFAGLSTGLVLVCRWKGEPPRWDSGKDWPRP